jgi:NitT/TauT family transport system ATP-binding protein
VDALAGSRRSESGWEKGGSRSGVRVGSSLPPCSCPVERRRRTNRLATIRLTGVSHHFPHPDGRLDVLRDVTLAVQEREVVCVVGPNGSGKSTLLRLIAGLLTPDSGTIEVGGARVSTADPRVALVFQEPRLLPWRRALDNVAFPLELAGVPATERVARARELVERVGLAGFERAFPRQLSGGMRQRLAIARALARDPQVLLLDEPFSALDALTRERFNAELLALWQGLSTSIVMVTHSIPEAVFLADRVLVLSPRPGRVIADVPVPLPRPRRADALDGAAYSAAATAIRRHLSDVDAPAA